MLDKEESQFGVKSVISNIIWKFLERGSSVVVTVLVNVFLARLLPPEDLGILTMVLVFVTLSEIFVTAGVNTSLTQKKDVDETDFSSMFWINLTASSIIYILVFVFSPSVSLLLGYGE